MIDQKVEVLDGHPLSIFVMFTLMSKVNNLQFCIALQKTG